VTRRRLGIGLAVVPWVQLLAFAGNGPVVQNAVQHAAQHAVPMPAASARENPPAQQYFTDVVLVNQAGTSMRLYSDLIKGRTVVIIPFFTTCTGACPVMNQNLSAIQDWLGHRLGQDAFILSISVDPSSDTVPVLREYARQFNARPGWYFLGGRRENVELALAKLGQSVGAREDHQTIMIIGNEKTGLWKKAFGLADSASLIHIVDGVLNDKGESGK
jgi:protein SCO1